MAPRNARRAGGFSLQGGPVHVPRTAYVLLWFPLSSETFVFREVLQLQALGLPIHAYTAYGASLKGCSQEMRDFQGPLTRLGMAAWWRILRAFGRECIKRSQHTWGLMREGLFRRMRCLETLAENTWCFFAAFRLAELLRQDGMELIHTPWGNGPGTMAWIASRLTGIPFIMTGRAGDIYPPDGVLAEKLRDAILVRTNNAANVRYLADQCPPGQEDKVRLVYNSLTFKSRMQSAVPMEPPYRILAVGRLVRTKGFDVLLTAMARLKRENFACRLTLVGDGWRRRSLQRQIRRLHLEDAVDMPGFVPHDHLLRFMAGHDMLVMPSVVDETGDRDGIPNVIMEALSNRLPVVATDVCGITEVVRHGETGLIVPQRDPAELARAIRRMAEDREAALRMAESGKTLVETMFDADVNIRALFALYCEAWARAEQSAGGHGY